MFTYTLQEFLQGSEPYLSYQTREEFDKRLSQVKEPEKQFSKLFESNPEWQDLALKTQDEKGHFHVYFYYSEITLFRWQQHQEPILFLHIFDFHTKPIVSVIHYRHAY